MVNDTVSKSYKNYMVFNKYNEIDEKINIKLQKWLIDSLDNNLNSFESFFGRNYINIVLEPLSQIMEIYSFKINELKILLEFYLKMQNPKVLDRLHTKFDDFTNLYQDLIKSKSMCIQNINTDKINKIIMEKHEKVVGLTKVSLEFDIKIAKLGLEGDPFGIRSLFLKYNEIYWLSNNIEKIIYEELYSKFEHKFISLMTLFNNIYIDDANNAIESIIKEIVKNIYFDVSVISVPPKNEKFQSFNLYKYNSFDPNSLYKWFKLVIGKENKTLIPFGLKYEILEPFRSFLCSFNEFVINKSSINQLKLDEFKSLIKYHQRQLEKKKNENKELFKFSNFQSMINGRNIANITIPFTAYIPVNRSVSDEHINKIMFHINKSIENLYDLFFDFILKLKEEIQTLEYSQKLTFDQNAIESIGNFGESLFILQSSLEDLGYKNK